MQDRNFKSMSTEELERLLEDDFASDEALLSGDEILEISSILSERNPKQNEAPSADEMWARFERDYLPGAEENGSFYAELSASDEQKPAERRKLSFRAKAQARAAIAALVLITVAAVGSIAAQASGFWNSGPSWVEKFGVGELVREGYVAPEYDARSSNEHLAELEELLAPEGVPPELLPTWIPEDWHLVEVSSSPFFSETEYEAHFRYLGRDVLKFVVEPMVAGLSAERFKESEGVTVYIKNGVEHYLAVEEGEQCASWSINGYTLIISGDLTYDEAIRLIDSVYEVE